MTPRVHLFVPSALCSLVMSGSVCLGVWFYHLCQLVDVPMVYLRSHGFKMSMRQVSMSLKLVAVHRDNIKPRAVCPPEAELQCRLMMVDTTQLVPILLNSPDIWTSVADNRNLSLWWGVMTRPIMWLVNILKGEQLSVQDSHFRIDAYQKDNSAHLDMPAVRRYHVNN